MTKLNKAKNIARKIIEQDLRRDIKELNKGPDAEDSEIKSYKRELVQLSKTKTIAGVLSILTDHGAFADEDEASYYILRRI